MRYSTADTVLGSVAGGGGRGEDTHWHHDKAHINTQGKHLKNRKKNIYDEIHWTTTRSTHRFLPEPIIYCFQIFLGWVGCYFSLSLYIYIYLYLLYIHTYLYMHVCGAWWPAGWRCRVPSTSRHATLHYTHLCLSASQEKNKNEIIKSFSFFSFILKWLFYFYGKRLLASPRLFHHFPSL